MACADIGVASGERQRRPQRRGPHRGPDAHVRRHRGRGRARGVGVQDRKVQARRRERLAGPVLQRQSCALLVLLCMMWSHQVFSVAIAMFKSCERAFIRSDFRLCLCQYSPAYMRPGVSACVKLLHRQPCTFVTESKSQCIVLICSCVGLRRAESKHWTQRLLERTATLPVIFSALAARFSTLSPVTLPH